MLIFIVGKIRRETEGGLGITLTPKHHHFEQHCLCNTLVCHILTYSQVLNMVSYCGAQNFVSIHETTAHTKMLQLSRRA